MTLHGINGRDPMTEVVIEQKYMKQNVTILETDNIRITEVVTGKNSSKQSEAHLGKDEKGRETEVVIMENSSKQN